MQTVAVVVGKTGDSVAVRIKVGTGEGRMGMAVGIPPGVFELSMGKAGAVTEGVVVAYPGGMMGANQ